MRKRKLILSVLLSAAMTASCITPTCRRAVLRNGKHSVIRRSSGNDFGNGRATDRVAGSRDTGSRDAGSRNTGVEKSGSGVP